MAEAEANMKKPSPGEFEIVKMNVYQYLYSLYICGDNTVENARRQGGLDARTLYPDFTPKTLMQAAKELYKA